MYGSDIYSSKVMTPSPSPSNLIKKWRQDSKVTFQFLDKNDNGNKPAKSFFSLLGKNAVTRLWVCEG